jgi:hypothetical protein
MAGEEPWDPGPISLDFRVKCHTCSKQCQFHGGQRVEPDCGHDLPHLTIDCDDSPGYLTEAERENRLAEPRGWMTDEEPGSDGPAGGVL